MGLGHALLVRIEIGIINSLFLEQTHLELIRSAEPQVCLGPWNCNTLDIQQIWQRRETEIKITTLMESILSLCPNFSNRPIVEKWLENSKPFCSRQVHVGRGTVGLLRDFSVLKLL